MRKILFTFSLFLIIGCGKPEINNDNNPVLLISFDGFRPDYLSKVDTPNFDSLIQEGVTSEKGMIPIYPSVTFANHYAIATGLYPENNGLIGNNMYDAEIGKRYSMGNREQVENPDWYLGEPIWNTVEKAGKKAGTMFWVGSETKIQDMRPTHWKVYDDFFPDSARVDSVISWFTLDNEKKIDLGTLYFSFVDSQGHRHGPDSKEVEEAIKRADGMVGYLIEKLKETDLWGKMNVIIVSDHGMTEVSRDRIVVIDDFGVNSSDLEIISGSPAIMFNVKNGKGNEVYTKLKENENHFKIYKKEDIPERFNIKNSPRMTDYLIVADNGYTVNTKVYFDARPTYPTGGVHGFDNLDEEMWALFVAHGPAFKKGYKIEPFENINIYPVIAKLMGVEPAEIDGNLVEISDILK